MMASLYHVTLEGVSMLFDYLSYSGREACDRDPCNFNSRGANSLPESIPTVVRCKRGHARFDAGMMAPGIQTNPARSRRSNIRQCTKASTQPGNRLPGTASPESVSYTHLTLPTKRIV